MTIGEQMEALIGRLSDEHRLALHRWAEVAEERATILAFLEWLPGEGFGVRSYAGKPLLANRDLVSLYLEVDEALADDARRALLEGETP